MALGASLMGPASAAAGIVPDYDLQWVTIGDPGNPAWNDIPTALNAGRGSVNYRYRMTQTEVTVEQWFEFAQAYQPFAGDALDGLGIFDLTGTFIQFDQRPAGTLQLSIAPGAEPHPAPLTWRTAARAAQTDARRLPGRSAAHDSDRSSRHDFSICHFLSATRPGGRCPVPFVFVRLSPRSARISSASTVIRSTTSGYCDAMFVPSPMSASRSYSSSLVVG